MAAESTLGFMPITLAMLNAYLKFDPHRTTTSLSDDRSLFEKVWEEQNLPQDLKITLLQAIKKTYKEFSAHLNAFYEACPTVDPTGNYLR